MLIYFKSAFGLDYKYDRSCPEVKINRAFSQAMLYTPSRQVQINAPVRSRQGKPVYGCLVVGKDRNTT